MPQLFRRGVNNTFSLAASSRTTTSRFTADTRRVVRCGSGTCGSKNSLRSPSSLTNLCVHTGVTSVPFRLSPRGVVRPPDPGPVSVDPFHGALSGWTTPSAPLVYRVGWEDGRCNVSGSLRTRSEKVGVGGTQRHRSPRSNTPSRLSVSTPVDPGEVSLYGLSPEMVRRAVTIFSCNPCDPFFVLFLFRVNRRKGNIKSATIDTKINGHNDK